MTDTQSASARLRETQQALAASQQDLTRVERSRADLIEQLDGAEKQIVQLERERDEERAAYDSAHVDLLSVRAAHADTQDQLAKAVEQAALARAELASARQELAQLQVENDQLFAALEREKDRNPARVSRHRNSPPNPGAGPREEHP
jgi:chromosome segregation ATPase